MRPLVTRLVLVVAFGGAFCLFWAPLGNQSPVHAQGIEGARIAAGPQLEEIYIARSVRESRIAPTEFCAQTRSGFGDAQFEDRYTFRSTATRSSDGRMVNLNVRTIGILHACIGRTSDPAIVRFYGEGVLGGAAFTGTGDCRSNADFPEKGLLVSKCFLDLSGLPDRYVAGLLTTNSMNSLKPLGLETNPRGYTQSSIATIRLWRKR
jgi:hypothetical protein